MPDVFKQTKIGETVAYVQKTDSDLDQEKPNVNPAIITQVHDEQTADLFVMHSNGSYHLQNVKHGGAKERGCWHFMHLSSNANG